ncbi:MAG: bifunctional 4-hydroxy-2-oxoglutarate aldolase/2-dehydro-3-deoxy-phosphogluconate aldolase [Treponema sp.]|jgi:2-dehydro-3-deoxyphosphogluconate aldolase/(4S)-4-hydroxy-2-oxoglutarate aldolase|nr:bifunctional 4-hydroxy-2-oxoglutarate aldolase/2-dehydro-3-deoxy-phosphogluconate aldolase [Treponema sp.]
MHAVLNEIEKIGIVPVIKIDDVEKAVPLAKALIAGGIPCAEITFRTAEGAEAIRRMAKECPDILVGAGTVLTTEQVDRAINAGAKFIVSPGLNPKVVAYCVKKNIPITPGCANPSDIEAALEFGLDAVKFFPAEQAGGLDYIKAVSAPYPSLKFMPTGGINAGNIVKYLSFEKILACGGSWMVSADLINEGQFDEITKLCRDAMKNVMGFSLAHIGINTDNENAALKAAKLFETMFGFESKMGNASVFAGDYVEMMKSRGLGANGHIAIATNTILRAKAYLERLGFTFREDSAKLDAKGKLKAIYLNDEIAGFAVHLLNR